MRNLTALFLTVFLFSACSPQSDTVYGKREVAPEPEVEIPQFASVPLDKIEWMTLDGGNTQLDFNPQVDILFVIDNSASMKSAEANLVRNINRFAASFQKQKMIDYHIGVMSVWDSSERFLKTKKDGYGIGDLRKVKNNQGQELNARFLTSKNNEGSLLASTINIGVEELGNGGPETEEVFSPLSASLQKTGRGATNEGFFRDQAQLVTIILTDADDLTTQITSEAMAAQLFEFKGGQKDKVSVYAALVKKSDSDEFKDWGLRIHPKYHPECFDQKNVRLKDSKICNDGFGPDRIERFVLAANVAHGTPAQIRSNHIMSLIQKDFGNDLAQIGSDITVKTLAKEIFLDQRPRLDEKGNLMIRVRYGQATDLAMGKGQIIPQKQKAGWVYDVDRNSIKLSGDINYIYSDKARFAVDMVPLTIRFQDQNGNDVPLAAQ